MTSLKKAESKIHGQGIFTEERIAKGREFYQIQPNKKYNHQVKGCAFIGDNTWIEDKVLNFVNHSCDANTLFDTSKLALIALREIPIGEEITVDYNRTETGGNRVDCNCGSQKCRGYFLRIE